MAEQQIPIQTIHLFPVLDQMLVSLLRSLSPEDWQRPTTAKLWTVKDVAAHSLDGNMRAISVLHNYEPSSDSRINNYTDLVNYLNELNATWVNAMKRVSPRLITDLLESTGKLYIDYLHTLDPFAVAKYPVAWAGETTSLNWFHIAREYTEKWHHNQQIRDAMGDDCLLKQELFYPCAHTFMQALPYHYAHVDAPEGSIISITITNLSKSKWALGKVASGWRFLAFSEEEATTEITISPDIAWRIFTKAIPPAQAYLSAEITGNTRLAKAFFSTVAVMA